MDKFENFDDSGYEKAKKKFRENGLLGVTAEDHESIGSTPDERLSNNPGKTLAELMSDEEIEIYLDRQIESLNELRSLKNVPGRLITDMTAQLRAAVNHLNSIGRLPEKFKDTEV